MNSSNMHDWVNVSYSEDIATVEQLLARFRIPCRYICLCHNYAFFWCGEMTGLVDVSTLIPFRISLISKTLCKTHCNGNRAQINGWCPTQPKLQTCILSHSCLPHVLRCTLLSLSTHLKFQQYIRHMYIYKWIYVHLKIHRWFDVVLICFCVSLFLFLLGKSREFRPVAH